MTDSHIPAQVNHMPHLENIANESFIFTQKQTFIVTCDNARSILPAMLQHSQAVIKRLVYITLANDTDNSAQWRAPS